MQGYCQFDKECRFAHGESELRPSMAMPQDERKYRTQLCGAYQNGLCPHGPNCFYVHKIDDSKFQEVRDFTKHKNIL